MEYKPKIRRKNIHLPFGYYVSPFDDNLLLPDQKKLEALHYAFRMKAKYSTSIRTCAMWLHMATGHLMTASGFDNAYKSWVKKLKKERKKSIEEELTKREKYLEDTYKQFGISTSDTDDIAALAFKVEREKRKKK